MTSSKTRRAQQFRIAAKLKLAGIVDSSGSAERLAPPPGGYVRWIREGLNLSRREVASRMEVRDQTIAGIEKSEDLGTIRLDTLRRAARALNCIVVYSLVPIDMFKPRTRITDVGAVLDDMAELTQRARRQVQRSGSHSLADIDPRREPLNPVIVREWEQDASEFSELRDINADGAAIKGPA